jgi:hypothetical protein
MVCKVYGETEIGALADGFLDEAEAAPIRTHIETCPACASLYRDLRRIHDALSGDMPDPPDTLVPGVMYKLSLHKKGRKRLPFGWATAVAAALALVVLAGPLRDWVLPPGADSAPESLYGTVERSQFRMVLDENIPPAGEPPAQFDTTVGDAESTAHAASGSSGPPGIARMALGDMPAYTEIMEISAQYAPEWLYEWAELESLDVEAGTLNLYILTYKMEQIIHELRLIDIPFVLNLESLDENAEYSLVIVIP